MAIDRRVTIETISRYRRSTTWTDLNGPLRVTVLVGVRDASCQRAICRGETVMPRGSFATRRTNGWISPRRCKRVRKRGQEEGAEGVLEVWRGKELLFWFNDINSMHNGTGRYFVGLAGEFWFTWDLNRNCKSYSRGLFCWRIFCREWSELKLEFIENIQTFKNYFNYLILRLLKDSFTHPLYYVSVIF